MNAIQRFVFNLFLFCFGFGLFFFVKVDSYALTQADTVFWAGGVTNQYYLRYNVSFDYDSSSRRLCLLKISNSGDYERYRIYSNDSAILNARNYYYGYDYTTGDRNSNYDGSSTSTYFVNYRSPVSGVYCDGSPLEYGSFYNNINWGTFSSNLLIFVDESEAIDYVLTGALPEVPFDDSLELDSFKVTSWNIGNIQSFFKSKFEVTWSDSRINSVQVRITGTANDVTYEGSSSPFKGKFQADQFVFNNGDVIHLVATPYKADGSYGTSLYYSVTYSDNIPFSNTYRKMFNNNTNDNTLTIPYNDTSGNDSVTLSVDGVTTNVTYKVNYNPVTNEYGDINLYEIYYSPVVVYPDDTSDQEVDDTQDVINNNYNTTNYYETTKNINVAFDVSFGDISTSDIGDSYNQVGGFLNGFGTFVGKLSNWFSFLFPFLPPVVSGTIVVMFGLVVLVAIVAFVLKIAGVIADFIDAIFPF